MTPRLSHAFPDPTPEDPVTAPVTGSSSPAGDER